jgi:hypothetical protein
MQRGGALLRRVALTYSTAPLRSNTPTIGRGAAQVQHLSTNPRTATSYSEAAAGEAGFDARPTEDRSVTAKGVANSAFDFAKYAFPLLVMLTLIFAFVPDVSPTSMRYMEQRIKAQQEAAKDDAAGGDKPLR